ncbi:beta-propeller fold lactonase family protein [Bifidobacterium sp. ESL0775]|uniref:lactonase family protein n=1 Tax=Bifidobacterium sp. ESL0775 TaxID=2983230 RepID=UPI0023FA1CB9|nr:beta-propeller fold lactonase family protein [Bifidobacterium sp. ESL0775]WEV69609.1 beta-propeller fold lactonase family protein [Bifidobacterium sp. ESL0775]
MIRPAGLAADVPSPTWMLREGHTVFAVLEDSDEVVSLRIEPDGTGADTGAKNVADVANNGNNDGDEDADKSWNRRTGNDTDVQSDGNGVRLTEISRVKLPASSGPTHAAIAVDPQLGRHLITADYADGTVCVLPIGPGDVLGPVAQVLHGDQEHHGPLPAQEGPHAHWILPLADGRVLSTDLGADRIYVHHWEGARLVRTGFVSLAPGTGPRDMHVLPGPSGEFGPADDWRVAVVDEWGCTVTVLEPVGTDDEDVEDAGNAGSIRTVGDADVPHGNTNDAINNDAINKDGDKGQAEEFWVAQTVSLGGDEGERPDQAASLAFVPDALRPTENADDQDSKVSLFSRGFVYVGLRGSERIVMLYWDGNKLSRLAPEAEPGWKGRGVSSSGRRPRHIVAIGNMLVAANEVSDNLSLFRVAADGEPVHLSDCTAGSPTVVLPLTGV